jgi:WG containing repeat
MINFKMMLMNNTLKLTAFISFFILCGSINAQKCHPDPITHKQGYDFYDGTVVIPFIYDFLIPQNDDIILAIKDKKMGAFDREGKEILPVEYHKIYCDLKHGFKNEYNGYLVVCHDDGYGWGIMDYKGKTILPMEYEFAYVPFPDLFAGRGDGTLHFFDKNGTLLYELPGHSIEKGFDDNTFLVIDGDIKRFAYKKGEWVFPENMSNALWRDDKYQILRDGNNSMLLNVKGDTILYNSEYLVVNPILNKESGLFWLFTKETQYMTALYDANSKQYLIPPTPCTGLSTFSNQYSKLWAIQNNNFDKLYNLDGKLILDSCSISVLHKGKLYGEVHQQNFDNYKIISVGSSKKGLYDILAKQIIPTKYDEFTYTSDLHPIIAYEKQPDGSHSKYKATAYNINGEQLLPLEFVNLDVTKNPKVLLARPLKNDKFGFINLEKIAGTKYTYSNVKSMESGHFVVKEGEKVVLISQEGQEIATFDFSNFSWPPIEYYAKFRNNGLTKGKLVFVARKKGMPQQDWIGVNEFGQTFIFNEKKPLNYDNPKNEELLPWEKPKKVYDNLEPVEIKAVEDNPPLRKN